MMSMNRTMCAFGCAILSLTAACSMQPESTPSNQIAAAAGGTRPVHKCLGSMYPIHKANNGDDHEPYCVDETLISHDSYCLRATGSDAIHVRGAASRDAFTTFPNSDNARTAVTLGEPVYSVLHTDCHVEHPPKPWSNNDLMMIEASGASKLKMSVADGSTKSEKWSMTLDPDPSGGHYYYSGSRDNYDYFLMLTDYNLGKMQVSDPIGAQAIAHGFRIEIYESTSSERCKPHRPDYEPDGYVRTALNDPPPNFHQLTSQASCEQRTSKMEILQPVSGGGSHDYP